MDQIISLKKLFNPLNHDNSLTKKEKNYKMRRNWVAEHKEESNEYHKKYLTFTCPLCGENKKNKYLHIKSKKFQKELKRRQDEGINVDKILNIIKSKSN